jgi:adenylate cyclase
MMGSLPDVSARMEQARRLKQEGLSMAEIVARMGEEPGPSARASAANRSANATQGTGTKGAPGAIGSRESLRVTLDDIDYPAYMVNHNFEVLWINAQARAQIFSQITELPPTNEERSLFRLLPASRNEWINLLSFHVAVAKSRISAETFGHACRGLDPVSYARLQSAFVEVEAEPIRPTIGTTITLRTADDVETRHTAYASNFREGIFVVLVPELDAAEEMLNFLSRRDEVIRDLLRRRLPVLTHLSVLVADLQGSVKICSELPPAEYFQLINEIWTTTAPIFRKHHGTCGKHVGDGLVYYFFPQADSDYLTNALACADEIRVVMHKLSRDWQVRKNWLNDLYLNTGVTEGQEWLGTYQTSTGVEFTVLGDTINQAARISDLARFGAIWATKSVIGKIPAEHRDRVSFGVRRRAPDGREVFVPSSFSQVQTLLENETSRLEKLREIGTLALTEIIEVRAVKDVSSAG